jgi:hypothetical protein
MRIFSCEVLMASIQVKYPSAKVSWPTVMAKYEVAAAVIATLVFNWNTCMKPTNWA